MIAAIPWHHEISSLLHGAITDAVGISNVTFWTDTGTGKNSVVVGSVERADRIVLLKRHLHNLTSASDATESTEIRFSKI